MAEDRREQELRAAAKQLAGVQRQQRPDQTAAARSQAGQKAQPQRTAQQATTQTANSNGSGKALSGQQIQQMRTTNTPAKESMSQTKQIQHQLEQEVADIMDAESFAIYVLFSSDFQFLLCTSLSRYCRHWCCCRLWYTCGSRSMVIILCIIFRFRWQHI